MIKLNTLSKIGIFAVRWIAYRKDGGSTAQEIANAGSFKVPSVHSVLMVLRRSGIVKSVRGKGYELYKEETSISIFDIINSLEGSEFFSANCPFDGGEVCQASSLCNINSFCIKLKEVIVQELKNMTLDKLPKETTGEPTCLKWIRGNETEVEAQNSRQQV